jgi:hypothetical protein
VTKGQLVMPDLTNTRLLKMLGLRVERLFVLGIFLIGASFIEMFVASTSDQIAHDSSRVEIATMFDKVSIDESHLTELFKTPEAIASNASEIEKHNSRARRSENARKLLGLPPEKIISANESTDSQKESYSDVIRRYKIESSFVSGASRKTDNLDKFVDVRKSPEELLQILAEEKKRSENKSVSVFGIEGPALVQIDYGPIGYKLPFKLISACTMHVLTVLTAIWLGSLYMTRQRELLIIAQLDDYKEAFPHILNVLPVNFHSIGSDPTNETLQQLKSIAAFMRTLILLTFSALILAPLIYSSYVVAGLYEAIIPLPMVVNILLYIVIALLVSVLIVQERVFIKNKIFFVG